MINTRAWTKLRYHPQQNMLWRSNARFKGAFAGRGSGKSEVARRYICRWLPVRKDWDDPIYLYALPTYNQARKVVWGKMERLVPPDWIAKKSNASMTIETVFGSTLYIMGLDKPERAEGVQWDGIVLDESCDLKPGIFARSLLPALSHRHGWCWRIGVPKRFGVGSEESRKFYEAGLTGGFMEGTADRIESYSWPSKDILTPEQIAFAARTLDTDDFDEQYNASWVTAGGCIFHAFSDDNIRQCDYDPSLPIELSCDFNVNPMSWCLGHVRNGELHIFDELFMRNCNTVKALDNINHRYGLHTAGWNIYGDAASRQRNTSASMSDYKIIHNDSRLKRKKMYVPKSNPRIHDRFSSCNALFRNALGQIRFYVDPSCKRVIADLKHMAYKEGSSMPEKSGDNSHMADAVGYVIHYRWPIKIVASGTAPSVHMEQFAL